jgi:hypothetical protein
MLLLLEQVLQWSNTVVGLLFKTAFNYVSESLIPTITTMAGGFFIGHNSWLFSEENY